jgi:hypothetical protein
MITLLFAPAEPTPGDGDKAPAKKSAEPEKKMPGSAEPAPGIGKGMKQTGPDTWEIKWDDAHLMIASMPFIAKQLWVRKVLREGKLIGYKLKNIKKDSLVYRAGFRNGDIVTRVNRQPLEHPLKLLLHLLDGNQTVVELEREGKKRLHTYKFVN